MKGDVRTGHRVVAVKLYTVTEIKQHTILLSFECESKAKLCVLEGTNRKAVEVYSEQITYED